MTPTLSAPRWMRHVLFAAGIYNLLWGVFAVVFPGAIFRWLEMAQPNYPQLWQCIGMIVGVYGLGYLIAASDPVRHWPIVLVGLFGQSVRPARHGAGALDRRAAVGLRAELRDQ